VASLLEYIKSTRPWTVTFSALIYMLGVVAAARLGLEVNYLLVGLGLAGEALVHTMVNMFNDYFDFKLGFDSAPSPVRVHPILNGIVRPCDLKRDAIAVGLAGLSLGVAVAALGRPLAIAFGAIGIFFGYGYSDPRIGFKYKALGDLAYPLSMAILSGAGFYVASGRLLPEGFLVGLPVVVATEGVLFANYWRDIDRDRSLGARTLAQILGPRLSAAYYAAVLLTSLAIAALLAFVGIYPPLSLISLASAAYAVKLFKESLDGRLEKLDFETAVYSYLLGALMLVGTALEFA